MPDKKQALALVADAVAVGDKKAAIDAAILCNQLHVPQADVLDAIRTGETRRRLGL